MQKDHGEDPVMTDDAKAGSSLAELTAEIVSAYVAHNQIASSEVAKLITVVAGELNKIGSEVEPPTEGKAEPAVSVRRSIRPDHLVCLICGRKQKLLKRHLAVEHELTPNQYRETFGLKSDYPMAAPNYAQQRREFAVKIGLGRPKKPARRRRNSTPGVHSTCSGQNSFVKFRDRDADQPRIGQFVGRIEVREDHREGLASLVAELRQRRPHTAKAA